MIIIACTLTAVMFFLMSSKSVFSFAFGPLAADEFVYLDEKS